MPVSEILFAAVADAVVGYALEQSGLADHVRAVLKIDPQRKAFQDALARAYTAFDREYPDLVASLFDESFLKIEAKPLLAQLLTRRGRPDPAELARLWARHLGHDDPDTWPRLAEATRAAADFLSWLDAELAREPALQALYDSRALERIAANTEALLRYFVEPVRALPTDYAAHIEEFLTAYLGTPERPVPFGGREDALATLDAWLEDTAMPYLLLTAPAGLGKSALLVRWLVRLRETRPDLPTVFVPVSIRYSTNLSTVTFAALAAQLARVYGEEVPTDPNTPAPVWKGICASYLRREPPTGHLLVVLDGLDEAADWDVDVGLFPQNPPPGLKVVVSARLIAHRSRPQDWRYALGWERLPVREMPLEPLTRGGLRDVLERMGVPLDELARRPFIVEELHRLTEGDPLLTRFYVEDLWGRKEEALRLRPEDLRHLKPGYEGYFQQWWEDQRKLWGKDAPLKERAVQEVLNLLATALGPLPKETLLELAHPDANLSTWPLEEALRPLARFVVHTDAGYVFGHPKLGDFFFSRLTPREQRDLEDRFLAWGKATLHALAEGTLAPQEAPAYVVRYYRAHLVRAGVPLSDLQALVHTRAWAQAWEALQGSYSGYLNDVQAVWEQAIAVHRRSTGDHPLPHLGLEIRCALIEASIHSLAGNLPPELPGLLLENDLWTPAQALAHVRQMPDSKQQARALTALAPRLAQKAPQWLEETLAAARAIGNERYRARALAGLAPHLPQELREEALKEALAAARSIEWEHVRAEALAGLAPHLPQELLGEALAAARSIEWEHDRARALAGLAPHLQDELREEVLREALAATRSIEWEHDRAEALAGLAPHLPDELREKVLREALAAARAIGNEYWRAGALAGLAPHLPDELREKVLGEALAAARAIRDEYDRARALVALAPHLSQELLREALAAARAIGDEYYRAEALTGLAPHLPDELREEVLREALAAARTIRDEDDRTRALAGLAPHLPQELLREALAAARTIRDEDDRAEALAGLAPHLPDELRKEGLREALAAARTIRDEDDRARALAGLAPHLPDELREEVLREALAAARSIGNEYARAWALARLAPHLPQDLLGEALAAAQSIENEYARARALVALAPHLPQDLLGEALAAARSIENEYARARALAGLAPHLPDELREEVLREALAAARSIERKDVRAEALVALVPHLPQDLLGEALAAARTIRDEDDRTRALAGLAPHLLDELRKEVLREALAVARSIERKDDRARALAALAPHLAALPRPVLYPLWTETLPTLARRTRKDLLSDLRALEEVIYALGGEEAIAETFRAIQDVGRWWP